MYYYRPYARKTTAVKRTTQPITEYTVETVWGAAAHAHRINGGYFKTPVYDESGTKIVKPMNRDIVRVALADNTMISDQDKATGLQARDFLAQQLTMKTLKGKVSEFDLALSGMVSKESFTSADRLDIAVIASQIAAYERAQKDLAVAERIDHARGYLADVGAKVRAQVEVTKSVWSNNYGVNFVSGITDTNQAVFFSYRERLAVGSQIQIAGTVKAHRPDATQLSRVRVVA